MCRPEFYGVHYVINPWMEGNLHKSSPEAAMRQWHALRRLLEERARVECIDPQPGLPDMTFTANAGLVLGQAVVLSRFFHQERRGEEAHFKQWFQDHGYTIHELPPELPFEGAGDALLDPAGGWLWAAYGIRTELDTHPYLASWLDLEVLSLRLVDKRFYHLDTCLCPLNGGYLMYYPPAFDDRSNRLIEQRVAAGKRIVVGEADAVNFACNAVNIENTILLNQAGDALMAGLRAAGFEVIETPMTEFMKAGGSAKCLVLRLNEPVPAAKHALTAVKSRVIRMEGHLLDAGLLSQALDFTIDSGGSFRILDFTLGRQRQSPSHATIDISAPGTELLEKILSRLILLGVTVQPTDRQPAVELTQPASADEFRDARLEPVTQPGVAPDDFYVSTIYPTEVRHRGQWIRVVGQRMDAAVTVVDAPGPGASESAHAQCKLLRDLVVGDMVVVGVEGLRTARQPSARRSPDSREFEEFAFMGAGVSSERRIELVVEQIAWDLRRLRTQGGKTVVVAGPVVVHTGASAHLARLVREGYVQALLGGNAIAVHDTEQALLGTSLGVDMRRGLPVMGGHRHHLKAINTIRRCGGIVPAVEQGILTSGIFYECVRHAVPFSLAGSIRDDGPLPDTQMNLILAQADYARLLQGADMILALGTMLHAIGVGNMTPAGVKFVCVDINPAVVTKLSDRGSMESLGVVTDVGLFLSLLVQQLKPVQR
jgi:lysine-ketoglutarate reductase/saccharopine dehydrogenase-like protein (TIGR00300 family)